jgi:2-oxoglutarate ferredoxin oxidoreductase subunit delta
MSGRVMFEQENCKGCELCVTVCPNGIVIMDKVTNQKGYRPATVERMELCTGCASCARICPDSIITVERD